MHLLIISAFLCGLVVGSLGTLVTMSLCIVAKDNLGDKEPFSESNQSNTTEVAD